MFKFSLFSLLLLSVSGCGKETLSDSISQEIDRSNAAANVMQKKLSVVDGHYATDTTQDQSSYLMELDLKTVPVIKDGVTIPQPSLTGTIRVWKKPADSNKTVGKPIRFVFSNGVYNNNKLSMKISGVNTDGINLVCDVDATQTLDCTWPATASDNEFEFFLKQVSSTSNSNKKAKKPGKRQ